MKLPRLVPPLLMVVLTSLLPAQQAVPSSLSFESIPPHSTPQEGLVFKNTGATDLTLSISITSPFVISKNDCQKGVKPGSHCNLDLTYSAQTVGEQDSGTLTINYGSGSVEVPLSGTGVSSIPTDFVKAWSRHPDVRLGDPAHLGATLAISSPYYYPDGVGEQVSFSCVTGQAAANGSGTLKLCSGGGCHDRQGGLGEKALADVVPDQKGVWSCTVSYPGDGTLGPASYSGPTFKVF